MKIAKHIFVTSVILLLVIGFATFVLPIPETWKPILWVIMMAITSACFISVGVALGLEIFKKQ